MNEVFWSFSRGFTDFFLGKLQLNDGYIYSMSVLIKKIYNSKHFCLLIIFLSALSTFANSCLAEEDVTEMEKAEPEIVKVSEEKQAILDNLKEGAESAEKPLINDEETSKRIFSRSLGPANFRLSLARGLELTWDDSDFSFRLGGRFYIDTVYYDEDKNDLGDTGIGMRTILVEMNGTLSKNWSYRFSWGGFTNGGNVSSAGVNLDDAYVRYLGFDHVVLTVGQHTEPFSLEEQTSSLHTTFMERALPNAFAPGTTLGISAATGGKNWFATGGFFSEQISDYKDQGSQGYGITTYLSTSPWRGERGNIHVGNSLSYRFIGDETSVFFRNRPESGLTSVRYVNTGTIKGADEMGRFGIDMVGIFGPWSLQGEYIYTAVNRNSGYRDVDFSGWYTFLSWFPTGENRKYKENGVFGAITPAHSYGAWELALRYSSIDLNDVDITGGEEQNITLGINWYIHRQVRLMCNYTYVMTDSKANDNGSVLGNDSPHILNMRFQVNF